MKWSSDAEKAIKKVPFFVRKKVKNKVEEFVHEKGKHSVDLPDILLTLYKRNRGSHHF